MNKWVFLKKYLKLLCLTGLKISFLKLLNWIMKNPNLNSNFKLYKKSKYKLFLFS